MKKNLAVLISLFSLAMGMATGASGAIQTSCGVSVNIPFEFYAANQRMPAGKYRIEMCQLGNSGMGSLLRIESNDGEFFQFLQTMRIEGNRYDTDYRITFNKYGDHFFLSKVTNSDLGAQAPKSRLERQVESEYILAGGEADSLEVVAVPVRTQ